LFPIDGPKGAITDHYGHLALAPANKARNRRRKFFGESLYALFARGLDVFFF
jgi:hypothetical protein